MTNGQPVWKYNKHGREQQDTIQCFKCQWFQPYFEDGGSQSSRSKIKAGAVPVEPKGASETGYCRKKSVPVMNLTAGMKLMGTSGSFGTNEFYMSTTEMLYESHTTVSNEFWCRHWVRSTVPFLWPPIPRN